MNQETTPPANATAPQKGQSVRSQAGEFIRFALIVIGVVVFVRLFIAQPFVVSGTSMVPTFQNGNYVIVDELSYHFHKPQHGDVIIFHPPVDPTSYYIKRVIGIPGDTVTIKSGVITVTNDAHPEGFTLSEPYITSDLASDNFSITVPDGQYFVLGDNRPASYDSRRWGLLSENKIAGRAFIRLFPISKFGVWPGSTTYANE